MRSLETLRLHRKKALAVLIDPDKVSSSAFQQLMQQAHLPLDFYLLGGSMLTQGNVGESLQAIRRVSDKPVLLFPGHCMHLHPDADALLFLSLISGRNPEFLIGHHVAAAPFLKKSTLEIMPTGYILIENERCTTVEYISNTRPIPAHKPELVACTAMAGEMLGLQQMFLDAGSGAASPVPTAVIKAVRQHIACPLWVGGGIDTIEKATQAWQAGADVLVVGNALEQNPYFLDSLVALKESFNTCEEYESY